MAAIEIPSVTTREQGTNTVTTRPSSSSLSKREQRYISWFTVALGALVPLTIAVGTIVLAFQQQKLDDLRRKQDQELANLTRMQDQELANLTRMQDLEIEQRRYDQDQRQAKHLHIENVYKTYIEDIANVLFKTNQTFADNEMKMKYIRSKTLTALHELNSERKTDLFLFLYENNLLPRIHLLSNQNNTDILINLSHSNLVNISIQSTMTYKYIFNQLSLTSSDLTNASFVGCDFINGVDFSGSTMDHANFSGSKFACDPLGNTHVQFNHMTLKEADFRRSLLCDVIFNGTNLAYANFTGVNIHGKLEFTGTNLAHTDFQTFSLIDPYSINIMNANITGSEWYNLFLDRIRMTNVIHSNGTWSINKNNLILNGNAEKHCSTLLNTTNPWISYWNKYQNLGYPTIGFSQDSHKCYFNLTHRNTRIKMFQNIDISNFSVFIDSGEAGFNWTKTIACTNGTLHVVWRYYTAEWLEISSFSTDRTSEQLKWRTIQTSSSIPVNTRQLRVEFERLTTGTCLVDDIELVIVRSGG